MWTGEEGGTHRSSGQGSPQATPSPHPTRNTVFFQLLLVTWPLVPAGRRAACDFTLGCSIT